MELYDLSRKTTSGNRMVEAREAALEGKQALVVTKREGREVGLLIDNDIVRLSGAMRRLGLGPGRLRIHRGGLYSVSLDAGAVARARNEVE